MEEKENDVVEEQAQDESIQQEEENVQQTSSPKINGNVILANGLMKALKLLPPNVKIVIALVIVGLILFLMIILCGAAYVAMDKFGSDNENSNLNLGYSSVGDNSGFWWPVGSNDTTVQNGVTFASGDPAITSISSHFSSYRCINGFCGPHRGFDISSGGKIGEYNLIATKSGTVVKVYNECADNGYHKNPCGGELGNYVTLDHGGGFYSRYQHMAKDSVTVSVGDTVQQGQVIGKIGKSGSCTGAHLHFQIHVGGTANSYAVDPLTYVDPNNPRPVAKSSSFTQGINEQQSICLTLRNSGFSDDAVAAIMGNMFHESGFDPTAINEINCRGIVQWCFGRRANLVATYGNDWSLVDNQLEYFLMEINEDPYFAGVKNYLKANHSVEEKAFKFCMIFEAPGESICRSGKRQSTAAGYYRYVQNGCR